MSLSSIDLIMIRQNHRLIDNLTLNGEYDKETTRIVGEEKKTVGSSYKGCKLELVTKDGDVEIFITTLKNQKPNTLHEQRDQDGNTYLHVAAMFGRHELIGLLKDDTVSESFKNLIKIKNHKRDTALHVAARAGHVAVTDLLLKCGQESFREQVDLRNDKGNTPLHEALLHNHHSLVDLLLHWAAHSSCYVNKERKSAFYLAVEAGNVKIFNAMFKAKCWTTTHSNGFLEENLMEGSSLLHVAISRKDKVMLQEILAKGMHMLLHVKDEYEQTPIEFASKIGFDVGAIILHDELRKATCDVLNQKVFGHYPAYVSLLVEKKDDRKKWDVIHEWMENLFRKEKLPQQCISHCFMDLQMYEAARVDDVGDFMRALKDYHVPKRLALSTIFSQLTILQNTALHVASMSGSKYIVSLILQYFPSLLSRQNSNGNTALHLAAEHGQLEIVELLVKFRNGNLPKELPKNTNLDMKEGMPMVVENIDRRTPLQLALKSGHEEVVEFMINQNVEEAYHVNKKGTSSLYIAILNGDTKLLKRIFNTVSRYVDQKVLDGQLTKGKSLVLAAIWSQKIEILKELAAQKPVLFMVKDEHAQKLKHFADLLGFHEGLNYLRGKLKSGVHPLQSYNLDAYSLSVIEMVDQKILEIMQSMNQNKKYEEMKCNESLQDMPQENQHEQSMDVNLYEAAKKGDVDSFIGVLENVSKANNSSLHTISEQRTHVGNTFLHVAASRGNEDLTSFIVFYFRNLLRVKNREGNTANHEAARAGHVGVLDILVRFNSYNDQLFSSKEYDTVKSLTRDKTHLQNSAGNTSLHEAFANNQRKVIEYLMESSVEEAYYVNDEGKSGLHLAVEADMVHGVKTILSNMTSDVHDKFHFQLTDGRSLINAAIQRRSTVMMQEISRKMPAQIYALDEDGQSPLFHAVSTGFLEGLTFLLEEFKLCTNQMNSVGFYPVHVASQSGHVHILQKLMQNYPDAGALRNWKRQNILHVAAMYGKDAVVRFILQTPDLEFLINERDNDGNTPLHLATIKGHSKIVSFLTWDNRVNLSLVNENGQTALDAAEKCCKSKTSFQQRLTWSALRSAGTPRAVVGKTLKNGGMSSKKDNISGKDERHDVDSSNDRVNTLLLVATLVATVTFAAGFTMPGGYNNLGAKEGQATLLHKLMLQIFVMCDTIALYSAIMVATTLIWAQLGDLTLVVNALRFALPLLGFSLTTMLLAFMVGVSLVVADLTWLATFVLIFGLISLANVMILYIPLCLPDSSTSPVLRYITYYPFHLLVLASGKFR